MEANKRLVTRCRAAAFKQGPQFSIRLAAVIAAIEPILRASDFDVRVTEKDLDTIVAAISALLGADWPLLVQMDR